MVLENNPNVERYEDLCIINNTDGDLYIKLGENEKVLKIEYYDSICNQMILLRTYDNSSNITLKHIINEFGEPSRLVNYINTNDRVVVTITR